MSLRALYIRKYAIVVYGGGHAGFLVSTVVLLVLKGEQRSGFP